MRHFAILVFGLLIGADRSQFAMNEWYDTIAGMIQSPVDTDQAASPVWNASMNWDHRIDFLASFGESACSAMIHSCRGMSGEPCFRAPQRSQLLGHMRLSTPRRFEWGESSLK